MGARPQKAWNPTLAEITIHGGQARSKKSDMLKKYAALFVLFRSVVDIVMIGMVWIGAYYLRFYSGLLTTPKGIPDFKTHLKLALPVVCICGLACFWTGLYRPKRIRNVFIQFIDIFKACILAGLVVLAFFYYLQNHPYSRKLLVLFVFMLFAGLIFSHLITMQILRSLRKRGRNLRYYAVIGTGQKAQQLVQDIEQMGWMGLKCSFYIDDNPRTMGGELLGVPVYSPIEKLPELVKAEEIDEVYLTLSGNEAQKAYPILAKLQCLGITVRIMPDWGNLMAISAGETATIGSQVLFSAAESPLSGTNIILKEVFDRVGSFLLLIILFIPLSLIAVLIKLTSKGPVLYKQTRIGAEQKEFKILKFRTMKVNAEEGNGPQWAKPNDPRCTRIGAWLRGTSLDELPQLINVLKGELSLVGPRPERPFFVKRFSEEYRRYMLRHKVKPGITGWAQINGFRGDTSLRKRLVYDLYYVRTWSFWLDLWILLRTPWQIIKGKNAY